MLHELKILNKLEKNKIIVLSFCVVQMDEIQTKKNHILALFQSI